MSGTSKMDAQTGILGTDGAQRVVVRRVLVRVTVGADRGIEKRLDGGTMLIGTSSDADLVLRDPTVSRLHAELALLANGVRVKDLGSTNGTYVGESRIESVVVPAGSEVRVGKTRIELLAADVPLPDAPSERVRFGRLVGASPAMRKLFGQLERLAQADAPVWLWGESGTGKTEAVYALHEAWCAAGGRAPTRLAVADLDPGQPPQVVHAAFETALASGEGGALLFERVDEASPLQLDAVRALVERKERERLVVRFFATSRRDPRSAVEAGMLSRDLFFHLAGARIEMPPLRDRLEDLPRLVDALADELGYPGLRLSAAELAQLRAQDLSGNVRQLRRLIEEALLRASSRPPVPATSMQDVATTEELHRLPFKEAKEKLLDAFEAQYVAQLLDRAGGNVSRAADEAGIDRNHLARLAKKHGLR